MATRNTTPKKITQTGPVGLRGIRNSDLYNTLSGLAESGDQDAVTALQGLSNPIIRPYTRGDRYAASSFSPQAYEPGTPYADLGNSRYDADYIMGNNPEDVNEMRYENQPWWDTLANGIGKMYGTAGTTFLSSLVGIPYGLIELGKSALEGDTRWSAIWDNAVTKGLQDANEWMDENLANYRSKEQQESPWYDPSNLFSMNFIADDIIRNYGFMMGAAGSMLVGTGEIGLMSKAIGSVGNLGKYAKTVQNVLGSLFSATGEGMIEAQQGVSSRNKLEIQRLDDALRPEYDALDMMQREADQEYSQNRGREYGYDPVTGRPVDAAYAKYMQQMQEIQNARQALDDKREAGVAQIEDSGQNMGNAILLANQGILTLSNLVQFSKGMTKGFDISRHAAETMSKVTKPTLTTASRVSGKLADGYRVSSPWPGRIWAGTKGIIAEGSEEMNQEFASQASGFAFNREDVNDYWKARLDPESFNDTTEGLYSFGKILDRGFQNSWGDLDQWQQFVVGGLTGAMGSYMPTKIFNQDKSKKWYDPRRYGEWQGGAIKEVGEFNDDYRKYRENIDDINKVLAQQDFPARIQRLAAHTFHEKNKTQAAENDDKKLWKDEDDKQTIQDIQAFMRAGRLSDLRAIYDQIGSDWSDEDIDDLVNRTTHVITADDDRQQFQLQQDAEIAKHQERRDNLSEQLDAMGEDVSEDDISHLSDLITKEDEEIARLTAAKESYSGKEYKVGAYVDEEGNKIKTNNEIREELKQNSAELQRKIDSYVESINTVQEMTGGTLTKDQEDNLAYLHNVSKEKTARVEDIISKVRKRLPNKFLIKTDKTPEQLQKQFASSDLAFSKNKNTKEGYVEVDTSLVNDKTFASFFLDNIIELKETGEKDDKGNNLYKIDEQPLRQAFVENAMQKNGQSLAEALSSQELEDTIKDIYDAANLYSEASVFYNTYLDYMFNPQKVEQAKAKEEKKNEDKARKAATDKASVKDMMDMDDDTLAAAVLGGRKGKDKSGKKAQKAMGMKNSRSKAEKSLDDAVASGTITREAADDALKLMDNQINRMLQENDEEDFDDMKAVASALFDTETEAMNDEEAIWDDEFRDAVVNGTVDIDDAAEAAYQARLDAAKDAINLISEDVEAQLAEYDQSIDMSKQFKDVETEDESGTKELDEKVGMAADEKKAAENPTPKSSRNKSERSEPLAATKSRATATPAPKSKTQPQTAEESKPTTPEKEETAGTDKALEEDKKKGESGDNGAQGNTVWGLWHSGVSEVAKKGNQPWTADPSDPNAELQQNRYDTIKKKLEDTGAYTARKQGKVKPGMKVGFKIFQDVNTDAKDFVVFITDEHGNVIGDLPSEDARFNKEKFPVSMDDLYKALHDEWDDATDEERQKGIVSRYTTVIDDVLVGKVRYIEDRQTAKELTQGSEVKPLFAIKRTVERDSKDGTNKKSQATELRMDTGVNSRGIPNVQGVKMPLTGRSGQPYVLIQTPGVHNGEAIKYLAVPIKTMTVGELIGNDTIFEGVLRNVLQRMKGKTANESQLSDFEARRILEALLSVHSVHVNLDEGSDTKKGLGIRITTHRSQSGITKGVPYTIYEGKREDMDVDAIIEALSNIQVNVSSQLINGSGKSGDFGLAKFLTINGNLVDYNEMLSEVAHTNAAEPMTVNDGFTIKPLQEKGGKLQMVENSVQLPEWNNTEVNDPDVYPSTDPGKKWTVKVSEGYVVYDEEDKPVTTKTHGKEKATEAAILAAEIFGKINSKPNNKPYAVLLNGKSYIYNPVNHTFKTYEAAEKDPAYVYGKVAEGKKLTEQEKYTLMKDALERQMVELDEMYEERVRQQEAALSQQVGQDMVTHMQSAGIDVEVVDDASKAAEEIEDAQLSVEESDEMEQIKKEAIANDTFMKAPNGKDTNLTERQWLQVRTKAFKKWFGDWEKVAKLDSENNADGITNKEYAFNGADFIDKLIKSEKWSEIATALKKKLPNLSGIKFYYADFSTHTPGVYGHDNIIYLNRNSNSPELQLHEFIHAITVLEYENNLEFKKQINELYAIAVSDSLWGKKALQNDPFYSHDIYGYNSPKEFLAEAFSNRDFANILQRIPYDKKESVWQKFTNILRDLFGLYKEDTVFDAVINSIFEYSKVNDSIRNNVSKVVDGNGEPLVVYHHTDNPNLTKFSTDFENYFAKDGGTKEAIFFDEEKTGTLNRKYDLSVFLNIRELNEYNETKQQLHDRGTTYREIVNNSAKKNNKTGGVHMKDFDDNKKEHQSIWIIHNPNQVKSATDNNGEFSTENPDINMLKVDGKILGFEHNGKLYLQKDALNPNLPMHEYTHLWDRVIKTVDPRLWKRGKEIMKSEAADLWKQIAEDENYGKRWKKEGKTAEELEDLIASEVHARLTGKGFEEYASKKKGTFAQLKQWILDACKTIAKTLGMSDAEVEKLTLTDWNNMTVRDFMERSITMQTIQNASNRKPFAELTPQEKGKLYDDALKADGHSKGAREPLVKDFIKALEGGKEKEVRVVIQLIEKRYNEQPISQFPQSSSPSQAANTKDHTEEVNKVLRQMEEERRHFKLVKWDDKQKKYIEDREGDYYRDDRDGSIHARVSSVNDADIDVIAANKEAGFGNASQQLKRVSTGAGNVVDRFVREAFDLYIEHGTVTQEELEEKAEGLMSANINKEDATKLVKALHDVFEQIGADWEINSSGIVASGLVSFDGETIVKVAGTIDLLAYNKKTGQYAIIDMKSHLAPLFRNDGKLKTDVKTKAKIAHWRAQQTLYKQFLETKYGIKISGIRIMPFSVNYSTDFKNTDYTVGDDGVLRDKGIAVDINPKYDGKLLQLTPKTNVKYDVGQLPDSVKRLLPRKGKAVVKQPEDEKVAVKGKLIDIRDRVPEGMKLSDFIVDKYKKDSAVQKLIETLEANRNSSTPVMMTQGSQNLLMDAIDQAALDKAVQEAKAAKEGLKIDVPIQEEQSIDDIIEELENMECDSDLIDFVKTLPEDLQRKMLDGDAVGLVIRMFDEGASDDEITQALKSFDLGTRNKKAVKEYTLIDLPKELRWMRENLPQLSSERRLQIVKGLIRCSDGTESFGQVNAAMILIGTQAAEGTVYHEAFHAVVQFLLTDDEINRLFDAARKRWGDMPAAALEERMADEFENYMKGLDPEDNRIRRFFRDLWRTIQAWLNRTGYIESLYRDINNGVYTDRDVRDDRSNALSRIRNEHRDHAKDYDFLTADEKDRLQNASISKVMWNNLTKKQQEYMLHCVV